MLKPNRLVTILLILAALLPAMGSPFFNASAAPLAVAPTLGAAASFGVLGGSTVTNTGPTIVNGDLGLSPGSAVTGFPPGLVVSGAIHAGDALAAQAQSDITAAYNALVGQACDVNLTSQDLGGRTLTPGVYCFDTSAQLTGQLTLDVQGNPNAVFVFQIGSTLTTASSSSVVFSNGGPSCNVFWQVGSSATFGTASAFAGNVIILTSATLTTGASVTGKVLARNGAVTLDSNTVARCVAAPAATNTPTPTATNTSTPTATNTSTPTATNTPTPTATNTPTPTATNTPTPVLTNTPTPLPTNTPVPVLTNTPVPVLTNTPVPVPTNTPVPLPTNAPTNTPVPVPTNTPVPVATNTPVPIPPTSTPPPLAVELLYFVADRNGETVVLQWATAQEVDNYGFNLYRASVDDFTQAELIHFEPSAIRGGIVSGATYRYLDTPALYGKWWYWLADIDTHGVQTLYNPSVAIALQLQFQVYLPRMVRQ